MAGEESKKYLLPKQPIPDFVLDVEKMRQFIAEVGKHFVNINLPDDQNREGVKVLAENFRDFLDTLMDSECTKKPNPVFRIQEIEAYFEIRGKEIQKNEGVDIEAFKRIEAEIKALFEAALSKKAGPERGGGRIPGGGR